MYGKRLLLVMQHGILSFKTLIIQCYVERVVTRKVKFRLASIGGSTAKKSLLKQGKHPLRMFSAKRVLRCDALKQKHIEMERILTQRTITPSSLGKMRRMWIRSKLNRTRNYMIYLLAIIQRNTSPVKKHSDDKIQHTI